MHTFRRDTLQTLNLTPAADAGQRRSVPLSQNTFTHLVYFVLTVVLVIGGSAASSAKFPGSAANAFDVIGINENGTDRVVFDPRVAAFYGQMRAQSQLTSARLSSLATGTYTLVETIPVWFANPNQLDPSETAFREKNPVAPVSAFVQLSNNAASNIVTVGGGTATVSSAKVDIIQVHNTSAKRLPKFIPLISQQLWQVPGANPNMRIPLMSDRHLSFLLINGESSNGLQSDVIKGLRLRSDVRDYIGPQMMPWDVATRMQELSFGGSIYTPQATAGIFSLTASASAGFMLGYDFQHHGQLSTIVEPNETNLRAEVDCAPAASGNNTIIRTTTIELVRDIATYVAPGGGQRVVTDGKTLPWARSSAAA